MKKVFRPPMLISMLFVLMLIVSCQKEQTLPQIEQKAPATVDLLKQELADNPHYQAYMDARAKLYTHLENFEIDIIGISQYLREQGIKDICTLDPTVLKGLKGGELYIQIYCDGIQSNLKAILTDLSEGSKQIAWNTFQQALSYTPSHATSRQSCLEEYNQTINNIDEEDYCGEFPGLGAGIQFVLPYMDCVNDMYDLAGSNYDICCDNGGSGCPP